MPTWTLPVELWSYVVGTLDNVAAVEGVGGDESVATRARRLHSAVEAALLAEAVSDANATDAEATLSLTNKDASFLRAKLVDALAITQGILAEPDLHPSVREEQEADLDAALRLQDALALSDED